MSHLGELGYAISMISIFFFGAALALTNAPCNHSEELQTLLKGDQDDRKEIEANSDKPWPKDRTETMLKNDLQRRKRVGEIFGEGCIITPADYAAAAMIYQHGTVPDHFFQTFIWSKRGVELGDSSQKHLMALGIDRYLMNIGQKQLFGSQAKKLKMDDACWCLFPVEKTFSEEMRQEYLGKSLDDQKAWIKKINGENVCAFEVECKVDAKDSPKGTVPGFW